MANVLYFLGTKIITYERKDSACSSEYDYYAVYSGKQFPSFKMVDEN